MATLTQTQTQAQPPPQPRPQGTAYQYYASQPQSAASTSIQALPPTFAQPAPSFAPLPALPDAALTSGGEPTSARAVKSAAEFSLREYMALQRRRYRTDEAGMENRLRAQARIAVRDLQDVRGHVADIIRAAEGHRWRRWLLGGVVGSVVPGVRRLFRRGDDHDAVGDDMIAANDTEYAFGKSKTMISRILQNVGGRGALASVAFFVFAALYVFQNEVSLRVARTVSKRLKRLSAKIEQGDEIDERDIALMQGWRWRVLLWGH